MKLTSTSNNQKKKEGGEGLRKRGPIFIYYALNLRVQKRFLLVKVGLFVNINTQEKTEFMPLPLD